MLRINPKSMYLAFPQIHIEHPVVGKVMCCTTFFFMNSRIEHEISFLDDSLCLIFMILVSLENVKKYSHMVARLPQRLKSTLFGIFYTLHSKKFQTTLILAFETNSVFVPQK